MSIEIKPNTRIGCMNVLTLTHTNGHTNYYDVKCDCGLRTNKPHRKITAKGRERKTCSVNCLLRKKNQIAFEARNC